MSSQPVVVRGATALAGGDLTPLEDAVLVVEGNEITHIGPANDAPVAEGAVEIDASGCTILPGFIDAHVHIGFFAPRDVLLRGVTTVRDLAWPPEEIFGLAARSRSDGFDGPTIVAAGQMLTVPGGYPTAAAWAPAGTGRPVACVREALAAVEDLATRGAAVIKVALDPHVGPTLNPELLGVITAAAHDRGLKVTAHIYGLEELDKAIDAGIDELAHMLMSTERIPDATLERMVERGIAVVPTLSCRFGHDLQLAIENLARFVAAGGRVIYGTDLGNEGPRPGIEEREVEAMAAAGIAPMDIVRSATVDSARWLGLETIGVLEPGMTADLVAVRGDATADAAALGNVELVVRRGRVVRSSL